MILIWQNFMKHYIKLKNIQRPWEKMSGDYQKNPWRGICIDSVSHVERQNLEKKLSDLYSEVTELAQFFDEEIKKMKLG